MAVTHKINKIFDKLLHNIQDIAISNVSLFHLIAATTFTTSSGIEVPNATIVSHITS